MPAGRPSEYNKMIKLKDIKPNPNNPRVIKGDKFDKLVNSIKEFPKMLELRPMVVNDDNVLLGGNMRLKALQHLKYDEIPDTWVRKASDLTEEEQKRFIISDNVGFGEWDWEMLANEWDSEELNDWGLDVPNFSSNVNLDEFFNENNIKEKEQKFTILLEYGEDDYNLIQEVLKTHSGTKEQVFLKLLGL